MTIMRNCLRSRRDLLQLAIRFLEDHEQQPYEGLQVTVSGQPTGLSIIDEVGKPVNIGGHDGQFKGHRFDD